MKKIDIVYLYEHAARELDVACAVKALAEHHHGLSIEIVHWPYGLQEAFGKYRPHIVVLPFSNFTGMPNFVYFWRKSIFLNLSWEQLLCPANQAVKAPTTEFALNHVVHCAWSESFAEFLHNQGVPQEHIFVSGNLAYNLYDQPYRQYFKHRLDLAKEYDLDARRKWVFFPENYGWAFFSDHMIENRIRRGMNREDAYNMRNFSCVSLKHAMSWCASVLNDDDLELIIRPRPATPKNEFQKVVQLEIKNLPEHLHIIKHESIREWILASDMVVSSYSTSLVEAAIAGKPPYMLEPRPIPSFLYSKWHDSVKHVRTLEEFKRVSLSSNNLSDHKPLEVWARKTLVKDDAIRKFASFLVGLRTGAVQRPSSPPIRLFPKSKRFPFPKWLSFLVRKTKDRLKPRKPTMVLPVYEKDFIPSFEIYRRTNNWKRILIENGADNPDKLSRLG